MRTRSRHAGTLIALGLLALLPAVSPASASVSPASASPRTDDTPVAGGFAANGPDADTGPVRFVSPDYGVGGGTLPKRLDSGDFDGDGDLDAAVVNQGPTPLYGQGVSVVRGDGQGHLSDGVTTDLGSGQGACDLAAGDWNGDPATDLVVLTCTTGGYGNLMALTAKGDGTFTISQQLGNTVEVQLAAGDFDGDGIDDFVSSQRGSGRVRVYLGRGNGKFDGPTQIIPTFGSSDLEAGDVNGDGDLDLVGAAGGPVWTMLGNGDGTFGAQIYEFSDIVVGSELALADFNGDAKLDVAVVDGSGGHVGIGLGTGDGHFAEGAQISLGTRQADWVAAGQVSGGKTVDLVAGLESTSSALLRGRGDGTFKPATDWVVGEDGLTLADIDADGRDDLLAYVGDRVYGSVAAGKGFEAARLQKGPLAGNLVDLNGDGVLDKVTGTTSLRGSRVFSEVIVQLGEGDGEFGKQLVSRIRREAASSGLGAIAIGDINEDGVLDVAGGLTNFEPNPNNLFWALGRGDGTFRRATLSDSGDFRADIVAVALADVTEDGHLDLIAYDLSQLVVRAGNGDGTFGSPIQSGIAGFGDRDILVTDLTGDGHLDVITIVRTGNENFSRGDIRLQQGDGDGTFTLVQEREVDTNLRSGTLADLNADGRLDVVTAGTGGSNGGRPGMWVLLTTPDGQLGTPVLYEGPIGPVVAGDVDLDGDPDLATPGKMNAKIDFYLNAGNGTLPVIDDIISAGSLGAIADLNGDGAPDVLAGGPPGQFAVHFNARG